MKPGTKKIRYFFIILLIFQLISKPAISQVDIFSQKTVMDTLKKSLDQLYNYDFNNSMQTVSSIRVKYPEHPAILTFDCLYIYWKNFPLSDHKNESEAYVKSLKNALEKAEDFLEKDSDDAERVFYCLFLDILLARQNAADDNSWTAFKYFRKAYSLIKRGFTLQDKFSEFYFSTGLYNYYREFFPEQHPFYKVFTWSFPSGNKVKGLQYLDKAATQTIFVMPEALSLTSAIYLKYENNLLQALKYAIDMNLRYPNNLYFKVQYIENLIQCGVYPEAELKLASLSTNTENYYKLPIALFNGMLQEKHYKKFDLAKKWYLMAINSPAGWDTDNYIGLAYYGLGNIYKAKGDLKNAKKYYKKANTLCEYLTVKKETDDY